MGGEAAQPTCCAHGRPNASARRAYHPSPIAEALPLGEAAAVGGADVAAGAGGAAHELVALGTHPAAVAGAGLAGCAHAMAAALRGAMRLAVTAKKEEHEKERRGRSQHKGWYGERLNIKRQKLTVTSTLQS